MAISIIEFNLPDRTHKEITLNNFNLNSLEKNKIYWIHSTLEEPLPVKLQLPKSVIDVCNEEENFPKIMNTGETLTLRIQCLRNSELKRNQEVEFSNLIIHLTSDYCFTASKAPIAALQAFIESYPKALLFAETPCFILFLLLDSVINDYSSVLFELELTTDQMDTVSEHNYNEVVEIKKQIIKIKRYSTSIRDILMKITGRKIKAVSESCRISLNNLFEHSQMIVLEAEAIHEVLNGILEHINNTLMQKMNESVKVLTAFAAIFLPLTVVTGIYGMNFRWIPELEWKYGYFWALFLMAIICFLLLFVFKRKKWF